MNNTTNTNKELVNKYYDFKSQLKDAVYNEAQKLSLFFGKLIPVDLFIGGHDIKYVVANSDNVSLSYGNGCIDYSIIDVEDTISVLKALTQKMEVVESGIKAYKKEQRISAKNDNGKAFIRSKDLYDEMCHLLTDYEEEVNGGICDGIGESELYDMLVKLQNYWEYINTDF